MNLKQEYKIVLDTQDGNNVNMKFYLANVLGHDFIHDMGITSRMGLGRWQKLREKADELLNKLSGRRTTTGRKSSTKKSSKSHKSHRTIGKRGGRYNINNNVEIVKKITEQEDYEGHKFFLSFLTFYQEIVLKKIKVTKDILDDIFGEHIKKELKEYLVLLFCKQIFKNYDADIILKNLDYNKIDVFDILIYDTMFYLFGLIDNPYTLDKDIKQIKHAFNRYIGLNKSFSKGFSKDLTKGFSKDFKGGAIDCENLKRNLSDIVFDAELSHDIKVEQINNLLEDKPLTEDEKITIITNLTRARRQEINIDQTFDFIMDRCNEEFAIQRREHREQQQRSQGTYTEAERINLNNLNRVIAKQALIMIDYCDISGNINEEVENNPLKVELDALYKYGWGTRGVGDLDETLLQYYNSQSYFGTYGKTEMYNNYSTFMKNIRGQGKIIINNSANIGELQQYVFCPITSIIDSMSTCPYSTNNKQDGSINIKLTNHDDSLFYKYSLDHNGSNSDNYTIRIEWDVENDEYSSAFETNFNVRTDSLEAVYVLENVLGYLINLVKTKRGLTSNNFWQTIISNPDYSLSVLKHGIIKSSGDIGQELTALCKFGGFTRIDTMNNNIASYNQNGDAYRIFFANDRPSGLRYVFIRDLMVNNNELLSKSDINKLSIGGYESELVRVLSTKPYPNQRGGKSRKRRHKIRKTRKIKRL